MTPLDILAKAWPAGFGLGGIVVAALLWRMRGEFATKADLASMRTDLSAYGQRIERMENDMRHLPTREDIHSLRLEVRAMNGELREMRAEARGMRDIMERTEQAVTRHDDIIASAAARAKG